MRFTDEKSRDRLKVGSILLVLTALLAMAVLHFDKVLGAINTLGNTLSPVTVNFLATNFRALVTLHRIRPAK